MAKVTGGDVLVRLLQEVEALREEFRREAEEARRNAKRVDGHLARMARLIGELADQTHRRLEDHEERLQALEAG